VDFEKLREIYDRRAPEGSPPFFEATGKVSSAAIGVLLELIVEMDDEAADESPKKKPRVDQVPSVKDELLNDPMFLFSVILCGANSFKTLRGSHPALEEILPSYDAIWKTKTRIMEDEVLACAKA
jgi:hypothetical protein